MAGARTISRWLASAYAGAAAASITGVVAMVLVVDFADRAYSFQGPGWLGSVLSLYVNLAAEITYQVSPAALLLAAGITVSGLRRQGELTALLSLGFSQARVVLTVLVSCFVAALGVMALNEWVVVDASRRAEEIKAEKFRRAGDFDAYFGQRRWFRGKASPGGPADRIYNVRGESSGAFTSVTIYDLDAGFHLVRRIDAARMEPAGDGSWRLTDATVSNFSGGERASVELRAELPLELPETADDFRLRAGRPKQLALAELLRQIALRRGLGLPDAEFRLELHNRLAYPLAAVPGALLAIRLALRRNRKGHLTAALAEGILVSLLVWALLVVFRALGLSGKLPPAVAAWTPVALVAAAGLAVGVIQGFIWGRRVPAGPPAPAAAASSGG